MKTSHELLAESAALEKKILSGREPVAPRAVEQEPEQSVAEEEAAEEQVEEDATDDESAPEVTTSELDEVPEQGESSVEMTDIPSGDVVATELPDLPEIDSEAAEASEPPSMTVESQELDDVPEPPESHVEAVASDSDGEFKPVDELTDTDEPGPASESVPDPPDEPPNVDGAIAETSDVTVEQPGVAETPEPPEVSVETEQVADAEEPEISNSDVPDPPDVSVDEPAQIDDPAYEPTGFQGMTELPPITEHELNLQELDDPTLDHEARVDKQMEMQYQAGQELVSQLSAELGPQFEQLRQHQSNVVHAWMAEQVLLTTILGGR